MMAALQVSALLRIKCWRRCMGRPDGEAGGGVLFSHAAEPWPPPPPLGHTHLALAPPTHPRPQEEEGFVAGPIGATSILRCS